MQEVRAFGKARFGKIHNVSTYEREFRRAREKWPHRFKETKVEGVEKAWHHILHPPQQGLKLYL